MIRHLMLPYFWATLYCLAVSLIASYCSVKIPGQAQFFLAISVASFISMLIVRCLKAIHDKLENRP